MKVTCKLFAYDYDYRTRTVMDSFSFKTSYRWFKVLEQIWLGKTNETRFFGYEQGHVVCSGSSFETKKHFWFFKRRFGIFEFQVLNNYRGRIKLYPHQVTINGLDYIFPYDLVDFNERG